MTIDQVIKLGDDLKTAFLPEAAHVTAYEAPPSVLPAGCPLYTSVSGASELFGLGENAVRALFRDNADFPALRLGKKIVVDVPGLYEWLHKRNGRTLTED